MILMNVERKTGVSVDAMKGKCRIPKLVEARQEAAYRLRVDMGLSLPRIGQILGGRDHTTILYGIRKHCERNNLEYPRNV